MKLIYEGFESEVLENIINTSSSKRLIQELNFKYGLTVVEYLSNPNTYAQNTFLMVNPDGFAVAKVWTHTDCGDLIYNYRSPYYRKDRGSDSADRETIHSKKLSTLMATLKRNNIVPTRESVIHRFVGENFNAGVNQMDAKYGSTYKQHNLNVEVIQDMMRAIVLGESPNENTVKQCKETLDKWIVKDKIEIEKYENISRFFDHEFYAIGADKLNHLVIGSVKRMPRQGHNEYKFEVIKPFKRVKQIPDELKAITLMNKVHSENGGNDKFLANIIPFQSGYVADLDVINIAHRYPDEFHCGWTLVPCSGL